MLQLFMAVFHMHTSILSLLFTFLGIILDKHNVSEENIVHT